MIEFMLVNLPLQTVQPFSVSDDIQFPFRLGTMNNRPCINQIVKTFLVIIPADCYHLFYYLAGQLTDRIG